MSVSAFRHNAEELEQPFRDYLRTLGLAVHNPQRNWASHLTRALQRAPKHPHGSPSRFLSGENAVGPPISRREPCAVCKVEAPTYDVSKRGVTILSLDTPPRSATAWKLTCRSCQTAFDCSHLRRLDGRIFTYPTSWSVPVTLPFWHRIGMITSSLERAWRMVTVNGQSTAVLADALSESLWSCAEPTVHGVDSLGRSVNSHDHSAQVVTRPTLQHLLWYDEYVRTYLEQGELYAIDVTRLFPFRDKMLPSLAVRSTELFEGNVLPDTREHCQACPLASLCWVADGNEKLRRSVCKESADIYVERVLAGADADPVEVKFPGCRRWPAPGGDYCTVHKQEDAPSGPVSYARPPPSNSSSSSEHSRAGANQSVDAPSRTRVAPRESPTLASLNGSIFEVKGVGRNTSGCNKFFHTATPTTSGVLIIMCGCGRPLAMSESRVSESRSGLLVLHLQLIGAVGYDLVPKFFFYDFACGYRKYLLGRKAASESSSSALSTMVGRLVGMVETESHVLSVDFFHWKNHTAAYCAEHCNPYELTSEAERDVLNTNVCEQFFAWSNTLKSFKYMTHESARFFLFRMAMRRAQLIETKQKHLTASRERRAIREQEGINLTHEGETRGKRRRAQQDEAHREASEKANDKRAKAVVATNERERRSSMRRARASRQKSMARLRKEADRNCEEKTQ